MSKVVNNDGVKAGCIYRIALENFVTYKRVELYPGPSLNLIIGPNGTGKSTFVCAIILGLCGKTSVIGRAKKISEYVRSGCENSTIEIELYRNSGQKNVIITRNFNLSDESSWSIDYKTVREKQVQELIASMNIQVDNLCQLLPQDRVQDFSKMDPQQLLRSTLSAVGGQQSVSQLDELIDCRSKQRGNSTKLLNNAQVIQEQQRLNDRLKVVIDAMQQRKEIEKEIDVCEKKKLWLEYHDLREKVVEYTRDKKEAGKIVATHKSKIEPLEKVIEKATKEIRKVEQQKLAANRKIYALKDRAKETLSSVNAQQFKLREIESSFQEKMERHRNRERELQEAKAKLEKLNMDKARLVEKVGDDAKVKMELAELHKHISKTNAAIDNLKKQKLEVQYDLDNNVVPQMRLYQNKIRNLEDVDIKRLETLRAYSEDCYKAVLWLRENRDLFMHRVYEPMMLEIKFTDPKFARYLESTVASRDLVAFTFESSQDMNLFLTKVRQEQGLKRVNALCSQGGTLDLPQRNIQQLSYLGFYTYLVDTISAPDAIVRYLCKNYNIHRIPIGNDHTYKNSGKVPANITYFYTENHRFVVKVSAYSGEKSSSTIEIRQARLLANTVDSEQLNKCNTELARFERTAQTHRSKMSDLDNKVGTLEGNLNELNMRRKGISEGVDKVRTISAQIRIQANKVQDIETEPSLDVQQEQERCRRKQRECVIKQCQLHSELKEIADSLHNDVLSSDVVKLQLDTYRNGIVDQETQLRELKSELRNVEATLENIENLLTRAKSNAKEKLLEAKRNSNNKLPQDPDFPYKDEFDTLPSDINSLQEHCYELQTRMDCMDQGDEQVIKEYEEREKLIAKLKNEVNSSSDTNKLLEKKMETIKSQWLPPLENLLRDIDRSFGDMFSKLGCAGEIKLEKGESDEDFDKYGISILVRFRASEQLQQLTRHAQSGGERALSTAIYLMSLQRLTTVPFRCVDEINQGMDPINERKMFELLVKVTTECDNAQYFLLTPKLLTNLQYNDKIMVHTIMNGQKIMDYRKWKYPTFLEKAEAYRMNS
ncbi:structural maintenance of chromosomes 5 [Anticarsia gemmatalis]|uniref:structural maintenance of chromosomes 5 n=1 Tax=Anticarsia gemmatalis TaxID=129554 RepID=UPI003F75AAE0